MDAPARAWRKGRREALIAARMALPPEARQAASRVVFDALWERFGTPLTAGCVAIYWPFKGELDPLPFARTVIERGGAVALPVVDEKAAPLSFRRWAPGDRMVRGVWDIPVPAHGEPVRPSVVVAPLVGFDAAGYRLGYGGGYYDRTLAALDAMTIGVGLELCRMPSIGPQAHDVPMDVVATEAGLFPTPRPA